MRPLAPQDYSRWRELYAGYADFYELDQTDEQADTVWGWLLDPLHELEGLAAVTAEGTVVGLAHFRAFARPTSASVGGYLDDLFVEPAARADGVADALLQELRRLASERGWTVVRWITADDNYRARSKYDRYATRTPWITYDMTSVEQPE